MGFGGGKCGKCQVVREGREFMSLPNNCNCFLSHMKAIGAQKRREKKEICFNSQRVCNAV